MTFPKVSAIIANWNGAQDLEECLPSVVGQDYSNLEIIVVDNGSTDASRLVAERHGVGWLPLERNAGLAGALNAGANAASGEFLLFLNNDLRLCADFVRRLVEPLMEDRRIFACDALQWDWEGRLRVHGRTRLVIRSAGLSMFQLVQDFPENQCFTFMASAANAMVRRSMFEELGGWDSSYFISWEDVDLFWRAWHRGWPTVYVPEAICWHKVGASSASGLGGVIRLRGSLEGRLYFAAKCLPIPAAATVWGMTLAGVLRDSAVGRWSTVQEKIRAVTKATQSLGLALRARRALYAAGPSPRVHLINLARLGS